MTITERLTIAVLIIAIICTLAIAGGTIFGGAL